MADYNVVKFCRNCKKRFVVNKSESKINYCDVCQPKFDNGNFDSKEE